VDYSNTQTSASIRNEATVRATADTALATTIQTLEAEVDTGLTNTNAAITNEATVRATADTALATAIQTLTATVNTNLTNTNAAITNEATVRATADTALATTIQTLTATVNTNLTNTNAAITNEATARATADTAEATARQTLAATVNTNLTNTNAAITNESTARATADSALARMVTSLSSGTSRVYTQTSAPISTGRLLGDVWYDTDDNYRPYVWAQINDTGALAWRDNSTGTYSKYVGQLATLTTSGTTTYNLANQANTTANTANTASLAAATAASAAQNTANVVAFDWRVTGSIGSATYGGVGYSGIILNGAKRLNESTGQYETSSNIILNATNIYLDGNVIISGTVNTPQLAGNAVSNSGSSQGLGTASATITVRAGARVSVLATYAGNRSNGTGGGSNTLRVRANGADFPNNTTSIFSVALVTSASSLAYISNTFVVTGIVTNYASTPATLLTIYNAPSDGAITFTADSGGWNETVSLLVMELAK
jgi:hypothetical protein